MNIPNTKFYAKSIFQGLRNAILLTTIIFLILFIADRSNLKPQISSGYVHEKFHDSEMPPTMGRQSDVPKDDDSYRLRIYSEGTYFNVACEPDTWYSTGLGDEVKVLYTKGAISGYAWSARIIE